jgi:hypothetical protein
LPRYALAVQKDLLYIFVPAEQLSMGEVAGIIEATGPSGPGHDPCLGCRRRPAGQAREARTSISPEPRAPSPGPPGVRS